MTVDQRPDRAEQMPGAARLLGIAGLIPFFGCALAAWFAPEVVQRLRAVDAGFYYAAVILSFLGGIRWGFALGLDTGPRRNWQFVLSVVPSLVGWTALLLPGLSGGTLLTAGFIAMLVGDVSLARAGHLPRWFETLRIYLSIGAILSIVAMTATFI